MELTTGDLSRLTQSKLVGPEDFVVTEVGDPRNAKSSTLCFISTDKFLEQVKQSPARTWFLNEKHFDLIDEASKSEKIFLISKNPQLAFIQAVNHFFPTVTAKAGISNQAFIHPSAKVHSSAQVEPFVYVGPNAQIGANVILHSGVHVGEFVQVGESTVLFSGVKIYDRCIVGARNIIHSGTVIGADGFGFVSHQGKNVKVPQVGRVIIGDDVEIGANTCVDRGALSDTIIGDGTKIDNLVQIAHNCVLGKHNLLCGFVGLAGNTVIGDNVVLGAQTGSKGHLKIGSRSQVAAQSGITKDIPEDSVVKGYPAIPLGEFLKIQTLVTKLPELFKRLKQVEQKQEDKAP